jgi:hypothetical protein
LRFMLAEFDIMTASPGSVGGLLNEEQMPCQPTEIVTPARKIRERSRHSDVSCRKMTAPDRLLPDLPVFRDYGHSLPIAVTDTVHSPEKRNAAPRGTAFLSGIGSITWRPAPWFSWIPPVPETRRAPAFADPPSSLCSLPPARSQPLNSDFRRARIRLAPVGVHIPVSRFRAKWIALRRTNPLRFAASGGAAAPSARVRRSRRRIGRRF